jgi:hypothetical protein
MKRTICLLLALVLPALAQAQEVTLRVVSAFAENTTNVKNLEGMIRTLNASGKGTLQLNFVGGPKVSPFQVGNAVRTGIDIGVSTGALLHQHHAGGDALKLTQMPGPEPQERRRGPDQQDLEREANMQYLGRVIDYTPFHLYLNKKIDKPDLAGSRSA